MSEALRERLTTHPAAAEEWERRLDRLFADTFRPRSRMSVSEWAAQKRILSADVSPEPGPWRHERTPYLVEVMDTISDPDVRKVVIVKSARVGYTEGVIGNAIGYIIDQDPGPIVVYQPTESDAYDWSKKQLAPMLRDTPCLAERIPDTAARTGKNTIMDKIFAGGSITIRGGYTARVFRRINARFVFFDEVSALVNNAGGEGDPVALGTKRAGNYPDRKIVLGSTPLVKGLCRITQEFEDSDQRYFHVPCPHCGGEQTLKWGGPDKPYGIKWDREVSCRSCGRALEEEEGGACPACGSRERKVVHHPETAYYLCEHCGGAIDQVHKADMVRRGRWIPKNPGHPTPGFFVGPALISLITADAEWSNLVREWLAAQEDPEKLQAFVNQVLGEAWEERGQKFEPQGLGARAEEWRNAAGERVDVPDGVAVITGGVDVQEAGWLELLLRGWGAGEESWLIAHHRIYGSVYSADTWARLEPLLVKPYVTASGAELRVAAVAVDSGAAADIAYSFVLPRQARNVYAIKGKAGIGEPAVSRAKTAGRDGVQLFIVGVDTLKDALFFRLRKQVPGPGYMHFVVQRPEKFNGADAEYYEQLGAEKKLFNRKKKRWEYVKVRERNEAVDLEVYAMAALHILGAGVRETLGARARQIAAAGARHREAWEQARRKKRPRVLSKGLT